MTLPRVCIQNKSRVGTRIPSRLFEFCRIDPTVSISCSLSPEKLLYKTLRLLRTRLPVVAPILYWTDADVWEYIRSNYLKYPSLYDAPFNAKRVGCVGCPLSNNRNKEFAYWPKHEAMWKKYSVKLKADGSSYVARKFPTFEANWSWWMEEKNVNDTDMPDCQF